MQSRGYAQCYWQRFMMQLNEKPCTCLMKHASMHCNDDVRHRIDDEGAKDTKQKDASSSILLRFLAAKLPICFRRVMSFIDAL